MADDTQSGQYRPTLLNASDYNQEAEEHGTDKFPKAKVYSDNQ